MKDWAFADWVAVLTLLLFVAIIAIAAIIGFGLILTPSGCGR